MGIAIINLPFGHGLQKLFMVLFGGWFTITLIKSPFTKAKNGSNSPEAKPGFLFGLLQRFFCLSPEGQAGTSSRLASWQQCGVSCTDRHDGMSMY